MFIWCPTCRGPRLAEVVASQIPSGTHAEQLNSRTSSLAVFSLQLVALLSGTVLLWELLSAGPGPQIGTLLKTPFAIALLLIGAGAAATLYEMRRRSRDPAQPSGGAAAPTQIPNRQTKRTMNPTFDRLYRQLGRATFGMLLAALTFYGITLFSAVLGFAHSAASFGGVAASLTYVFIALFSLFLLASVVAAGLRWFDGRNQSETTPSEARK
jgi:hypothetical protein